MKPFKCKLWFALFFILFFSTPAFADPPQEEIDFLLGELGWEMADLHTYLDSYEESLANFTSIDELKEFLGTSITPENLIALLDDYEMSREDLDILLAEFGETLNDYRFIEDLEIAINFYREHDDYMLVIKDFLVDFGLTEEEAGNLFTHLEALDQVDLEANMEKTSSRLEGLMLEDPNAEITEVQKEELLSIWEEMITSFQLNPKFYLVDATGKRTAIPFSELANMEELPASALLVELYHTDGDLIADLQVSADILNSQLTIDAGEKLTDIGDLAGELTKLKHQKLPDTASPYLLNMLIGFVIFLAGATILFTRKRRVT